MSALWRSRNVKHGADLKKIYIYIHFLELFFYMAAFGGGLCSLANKINDQQAIATRFYSTNCDKLTPLYLQFCMYMCTLMHFFTILLIYKIIKTVKLHKLYKTLLLSQVGSPASHCHIKSSAVQHAKTSEGSSWDVVKCTAMQCNLYLDQNNQYSSM